MPGDEFEGGDESAEQNIDAGGELENSESANAGADVGGDDYTPPSREEYEALKSKYAQAEKFASVGAEFAPYANAIRGLIARGFSPAEAKAEVKKNAEQEQPAEDEFSAPDRYAKWWDKVGTDPRAFRSVIHREALSAAKDRFSKLDALEKRTQEQDAKIQELLGFATIAQRKFQVDQNFSKHEKRALELVNSGKVMDLNLAFEMAQREAKLKEYEAKLKVGDAAARKVPAKPAPRDDKSLHESRSAKGRTRGTSEPVQESKGRSRGRAALEAAAREVGL